MGEYHSEPRTIAKPETILPSLKAKLVDRQGNIYEWNLVETGCLRSFVMIESTNVFLPTLELIVLDRGNELLGSFTIAGTDKLIIDLSNLTGDSYKYEFELYSIKEAELRSLLDIGSNMMTMTFWTPRWRDLFQGFKVRSFGKMPASAVADAIIDADEKEIEDSLDARNYIQAQWTDAQFLRHLARYAVGRDSAGYWYFFDRYDKFFFCTPAYLIKKPLKEGNKFEFVNMPDKIQDMDPEIKPILAWRLVSNYKTLLLQSGYGSVVKYFDYDTKSYKERTVLYDSTRLPALTDWVYLPEDDLNANRIRSSYQGNITDLGYYDEPYRAASRLISNTTYSLLSLEVIIRGDKNILLGDKISVRIPESAGPIGESLDMTCISGEWLISRISHMIDVRQRSYLMKLVLVRSGINKSKEYGDVKGLTPPAGERV